VALDAAKIARLTWLRREDGGRDEPPSGPDYSTVAKFPDQDVDWNREAWSLVIRYLEAPNLERMHKVTVRFLSDAAPAGLLAPGSRFELWEGRKLVARGVVLQG
jgi:hypothetical protein